MEETIHVNVVEGTTLPLASLQSSEEEGRVVEVDLDQLEGNVDYRICEEAMRAQSRSAMGRGLEREDLSKMWKKRLGGRKRRRKEMGL